MGYNPKQYPIYKLGYKNPFTNILLTSWDIQQFAGHASLGATCVAGTHGGSWTFRALGLGLSLNASDTVDGSEIRRSPVEGTVVSPIFCRVLAPSKVVVWDFVHQQYWGSDVGRAFGIFHGIFLY